MTALSLGPPRSLSRIGPGSRGVGLHRCGARQVGGDGPALLGQRASAAEGGADAGAGGWVGARGGAPAAPRPGHFAASAGKIPRASRGHLSRPSLAAPGQEPGGSFTPDPGLRMVQRGLRHAGGLVTGSGILQPGFLFPYIITFISVAIGVYSLRPLYFAIMEEGKIPYALTGTAVGIVSVVGYTPDIFVGPLMGLLLDNSPGEAGHRHLFLFLAMFACLGLAASIMFRKLKPRK